MGVSFAPHVRLICVLFDASTNGDSVPAGFFAAASFLHRLNHEYY